VIVFWLEDGYAVFLVNLEKTGRLAWVAVGIDLTTNELSMLDIHLHEYAHVPNQVTMSKMARPHLHDKSQCPISHCGTHDSASHARTSKPTGY
jgi:hypothetical protein